MSTPALLEDLRRRDVRLKADGLTLRVDAPAGAATDELRATLREHKRALIRGTWSASAGGWRRPTAGGS